MPSGNDYKELMSYKEFNTGVETTTKQLKDTLKRVISVHPKLSAKLTVNEKNRPNDDDVVTHAVDFLLESIEIEETMKGSVQRPQKQTVTLEKPQTRFTDKPDNFATVYTPVCRKKYHSTYPTDTTPHPYINEIRQLQNMPWQLEHCTPEAPLAMENTPLLFVDTEQALQEMTHSLNNVNQFSVDVEHHSEHSYNGFVCLVQISTRSQDFVVDALALRDHMHLLNDPFTNPNIEKVFHGCDYDVIWLSYNFGLYVVNCIDSGQAARALKLQHFSLKYLLSKYVGIDVDKKYQLADWRIRPLTKEMIQYARGDTHYLLYVIDQMRNECIDQGVLPEVLRKSNELCLRLFRPVVVTDVDMERVAHKHCVRGNQMGTFKELYMLRDRIAREEDESPNSVLPLTTLASIVNSLPTDMEKLKLCCLPKIPYFVEMHASEFIETCKKARADLSMQQMEEMNKETRLTDSIKFVEATLDDGFKRAVVLTQLDFEPFI